MQPVPCRVAAIAAAMFLIVGPADAQPTQDWVRTEIRDDCTDYNPLRNAYFGESHVHTALSFDAVMAGLRTGPRESYMFGTGLAQDLPPYDLLDQATRSYTMNRSLDWMAVTDHAEFFGEVRVCYDDSYPGYYDELCVGLRDFAYQISTDPDPDGGFPDIFLDWFIPQFQVDPVRHAGICGANDADCITEASLAWQDTQDAAEEFYDRSDACSFTTFVGYEWTSSPNTRNLHRNVLFRNAAVPGLPVSAFETTDPGELFDLLDAECMDQPGACEALTIPHNSNLSDGRMFEATLYDGSPMTPEYAEQRARIETMVEIFQTKGSSECRWRSGSTDEQCLFETLGRGTPNAAYAAPWRPTSTVERLSFVRNALTEGFALKADLGVNPFRFGFLGGTDGHSNLPGAVNEEEYGDFGHLAAGHAQPVWMLTNDRPNEIDANPGGLGVVWAEENSRDAIFAALQRREGYATSGPRIGLRMFGGRMPKDLCEDPSLVAEGYAHGVPMGGDLGSVKGKKSPSFVVLANKDPGGNGDPSTPLQRVEIVKAWVDKDGAQRERVFHVAGEKVGKSEARVDTTTCTPDGAGYDTLCGVWSDPTFNATEDASYYARVIENPVCRWHQYICNDAGVDCSDPGSIPEGYENCCSPNWPSTIQERAWSSPIFYVPEEVGIAKAKLKYGKNGGDDRLKLTAAVGRIASDFDVTQHDLTIVLRDDDDFFSATIPAGSFEGADTKFKYKDKEGTIGGIKTAKIKISDEKPTTVKLSTIKTDYSAADRNDHTVEMELSIGSYASTYATHWEYDGKSLAVPK